MVISGMHALEGAYHFVPKACRARTPVGIGFQSIHHLKRRFAATREAVQILRLSPPECLRPCQINRLIEPQRPNQKTNQEEASFVGILGRTKSTKRTVFIGFISFRTTQMTLYFPS